MTELSKQRVLFEKWIAAPPYERSLVRFKEDESWPGHYKNYPVQLAWEAWREAFILITGDSGKEDSES
jgi:hypothetical protein